VSRPRAARARAADLAVLALAAAFFAAWYAPAVFGGAIWTGEDTAAYFFSNRARLHALAHADGFSWWDPVPGLGQPRLANIQSGIFAPLSLLFYLLPTATVFRFYPPLVLTLLTALCFGLFRVRGARRLPALLGALGFATMGTVATHVQHLSAIETLLWWPAVLLCWELHLRGGGAGWLVAAGLAFAFQCFGALPQYVFYGCLLMAVWMGAGIWERRADRRAALRAGLSAVAVAGIGLGVASWQLLPFAEFAQHSHRMLLHAPERFLDRYRAAAHEIPLALAAESFWLIEAPPQAYGAPYPNLPNLSLVVVGLAVLGLLRRPRPWWAGAAVLFFLLGMLGSAGGVGRLLGAVVPFASQLRAPRRMIVPAGFLLCWLACRGLDGIRPPRRAALLAAAASLWVACVAWTTRRGEDAYVTPDFFEVPAAVRSAQPRVAVDVLRSPALPGLFAVNASLAAGVPTLLQREVLVPANFFEAYFASQFGSLEQVRMLDAFIEAMAVPLLHPDAPLLRAFGLRSVLRYVAGGVRVDAVADALPDHFVTPEVEVIPKREARWKRFADAAWDPGRVALVAQPVPRAPRGGQQPAAIQVLEQRPDRERLEVDSGGGLLVTSGLYFPGWRVWVDGEELPPVEVDGALRAVPLASGRHAVLWRYEPRWLGAAWLASAAAALLAAGTALASRRTQRGGTRMGSPEVPGSAQRKPSGGGSAPGPS
jgi:hypothetical protein